MSLEEIRKFLEGELRERLGEIDRNNIIPEQLLERMASLGLFGLTIPKEYGGRGISMKGLLEILETISKECPSVAHVVFLHSMAYDIILRFGSEGLKKRYLPEIATGRKILALPFTEPKSGTDLASIELKAVKDGEFYILKGVKTLATNGAYAKLFIVLARTGEGRKGLTLFLVEKEDGVISTKPLDLMCSRGAGISTLRFENVRVHKSRIIGSEGNGFALAVKGLGLWRVPFSSIAIGIAKSALEESVRWSLKRKAFGKPIFENQAISFPLAEVAAELEAVRALRDELGTRIEKGEIPMAEASMVKLLSSELAVKATRLAIQIMGGWGLSNSAKVSRLYRDAKALEIAEGTSEAQKMIIARQLLKEYST